MTVLARATVATLDRPSVWVVAFAGFIARGGLVPLLVPILPFPSTVGLATLVDPTSFTAGGLTPATATRIAAIAAVFAAWYVIGGVIGALADIATVGALGPAGHPGAHRAGPIRVARLVGLRTIALLPLVATLAIVARPIGETVYRELTQPHDIAASIVVRVLREDAPQVLALVVAWLVGETLGGIAVRLAILEDRSMAGAIRGTAGHLVRRPLATVLLAVVGFVVFAVMLGAALGGVAWSWSALRVAISDSADGFAIAGTTILTVAGWTATCALAAVVSAWRGAGWTAEVAASRPPR